MDIGKAIKSLQPNAQFSYDNEDYSTIVWYDESVTKPTEAEIQAEITRLQAEYDAQEYARNRAKEYPPMEDYLDGVVKGDQAQIDKYIADCLAVKDKYPKGGA